jgi:hypothetical protein
MHWQIAAANIPVIFKKDAAVSRTWRHRNCFQYEELKSSTVQMILMHLFMHKY